LEEVQDLVAIGLGKVVVFSEALRPVAMTIASEELYHPGAAASVAPMQQPDPLIERRACIEFLADLEFELKYGSRDGSGGACAPWQVP
jgi:hypothetical protein